MTLKAEKNLFIVALIISLLSLTILYIVGVDLFNQPEQVEYVVRSFLYVSGLVTLRGIWKLTLDRKIESRKK